MRPLFRAFVALLAGLAAGCGTDPGNDINGPVDLVSCTSSNTLSLTLGVGQYQIVDPVHQTPCVALPASVDAQEYVVVAYSGNGVSTQNGVYANYAFQSQTRSVASVGGSALSYWTPGAPQRVPSTPRQFEQALRTAERTLAASPARHFGAIAMPPAAPPLVGDRDSFYVCATSACSTFKRVGATVKYAGAPGVIYQDDNQAAVAEPYTTADFQQLGAMFDNYLYPADTTAFGRESDINSDQHIAILITPQVNALTTDCSSGRVIGYTFANDLVPGARGSNGREMFYTLSTAPATASCTAVTREGALGALPSTLIHELQHMISFNQHVLLRNGLDQDIWLNEGLSHFAEELGWRTVPPVQCGGNCFSQFASDNISNAYDYLVNPEGEYLIAPESGDGTLPERGAAWLFLRWLADHYSTDSILGTQFTRALGQSTTVGAARIAQVTGIDFPWLVGEWQLANWTSDLNGFPIGGLLTYHSWNFRSLFALNYGTVFNKRYPLTPDSTSGGYSHAGTLYGGSGRTVRFKLPGGSPGVMLRMAGSKGNAPIDATILPNLAIVRIQ